MWQLLTVEPHVMLSNLKPPSLNVQFQSAYTQTSSVKFSIHKTFLISVSKSTSKNVKTGFKVHLFHQTTQNLNMLFHSI
jgi:hypothetical protein